MFPKLLTTSDDILIFGEMQDKCCQLFRVVRECHNAEGAEPGLNLEKDHCAWMEFSKKQKSVSAPEKVLLAKPVGVSWVWDMFLAVPQKFQCYLGAYASCSHIRRNRHMSNLFHSWSASFVGSRGMLNLCKC